MFKVPAILLALASPAAALAADFRLGGDADLNCELTMTGPIAPGDAQKFRDALVMLIDDITRGYDPEDDYGQTRVGFISEPGMLRICLDSQGGSLVEALEMADTLAFGYRVVEEIAPAAATQPSRAPLVVPAIGTAIPAGARCESACAVLFMAGGFFSTLGTTDNLREVDRVLHVDGQLGFHAPSLQVPGGSYNEDTVGQAFDVAIGTIDKLSERLFRYRFPSRLFNRMVSTPPDEMFYIETVEQAASWSIQLAGAPLIDHPSPGNLDRLCANTLALSRTDITGAAQYSRENIPADIRDQSMSLFYHDPGVGHSVDYGWTPASGDGDPVDGHLAYDTGLDCSVRYDVATGAAYFDTLAPRQHGLHPLPGETLGWALFPGYLTLPELSELARAHPSGRVPGDTLLPAVTDELSGNCAQYDAYGQLTAGGRCTATLRSRQRADRRGSDDLLVTTWPDGRVTEQRPGTVAAVGDRDLGWEYVGYLAGAQWDPGGNLTSLPETFQSEPWADINGCFRDLSGRDFRCFLLAEVTRSSSTRWRR